MNIINPAAKTNRKYIALVAVLAAVAGGGILTWQYFGAPKEEVKAPEEKVPEEITTDETANWKTYRFGVK